MPLIRIWKKTDKGYSPKKKGASEKMGQMYIRAGIW
jgi:hypothetical protein